MCFVFPENSPRSSGKGGCRYEGAQTCLNATTKLPEFIFLSCVPWPRHNIVQHQNNWWIALQAICKSQPLGCNPPKGVDITSDGAGDVTAAVLLLDLTSCTLGIELSSFWGSGWKFEESAGFLGLQKFYVTSLPHITKLNANDGHTRSWRTPWAGAPERDGAVDCGARRGPEGRPTGDRQNVGSDRGRNLCASFLGYLYLKQSLSLILDRCSTLKKKQRGSARETAVYCEQVLAPPTRCICYKWFKQIKVARFQAGPGSMPTIRIGEPSSSSWKSIQVIYVESRYFRDNSYGTKALSDTFVHISSLAFAFNEHVQSVARFCDPLQVHKVVTGQQENTKQEAYEVSVSLLPAECCRHVKARSRIIFSYHTFPNAVFS